MLVSVIIPTLGRGEKLRTCLRALARQSLTPSRYEVLVGFDGPDPQAEAMARAEWEGVAPLRTLQCPRSGLAAVRNALLQAARGRYILSLNDDVRPSADLLVEHVRAHERAGRSAVVVGDAPWLVPTGETLFDRLIRRTSMIFFYDRMPGAIDADHDLPPPSPDKDWGYRHAFGLNVSFPAAEIRALGGWLVLPERYGYEDVEIAYRLRQRTHAPVLFCPAARATHDHRIQPEEYLRREHRLGRSALGFCRANPACARDLFGRDLLAPDELAYSREYVRREEAACARLRESLDRCAHLPGSLVDAPGAGPLLRMIYESHLPLKRLAFRRGLLEALDEEASAGGRSPAETQPDTATGAIPGPDPARAPAQQAA